MSQIEQPPEDTAVPLREYLAILRLRKWSIIGITALVVASAMFFSFQQTPVYESTAKVLVKPVTVTTTTGAPALPPNLETERELAASAAVAEVVAENLNLPDEPEVLLEDLTVEVATNTEILEIRYAHPDPLEAQRRAQAFARGYIEFRRDQALDDLLAASQSVQQRIRALNERLAEVNAELERTTDPSKQTSLEAEQATLISQIAVLQGELSDLSPAENLRVGQIVAPADLPSSPASPNYLLNAALALFVGLALGVGFAFLRERLDDRLRGRQDLEAHAGTSALAVVPRISGWRKRDQPQLVTYTAPRSASSEAYRTLRTSLLFAASQEDLRTVLITSSQVGEGKTTTVANLGMVLAQAGKRVILVDADLRKPRLHRFFQIDSRPGLTGMLSGEASAQTALIRLADGNLAVLPCGEVPGNPAEVLGSDRMGNLVRELRGAADVVLIDSPPVLVAADATILASFADAVLLVADSERTSRGSVGHARVQLDQVNARMLGAVLNNFDPSKALAYPYYYQYYYRYEEPPPGNGRAARRAQRKAEKAKRSMWSS